MANIDKVTINGTDYKLIDSTVPSWAKASTKPSYTASEISGLAAVATSGSYNDLSNKPDYVSSVTYDSSTRTINVGMAGGKESTPVTLASVATSGSYNDLTNKPTIPAAQVNADWNATSGVSRILNKPTIPTVPTKVSSFTNDAGYLTQHQSLANYYTKSEIDTKIGNIETILASI